MKMIFSTIFVSFEGVRPIHLKGLNHISDSLPLLLIARTEAATS